jgi:hypothetical protein
VRAEDKIPVNTTTVSIAQNGAAGTQLTEARRSASAV